MPPDSRRRELAEIEALIARAEAELAELARGLEQDGHGPDPSDPFDPVGCLEIWLRALRDRRDELVRRAG